MTRLVLFSWFALLVGCAGRGELRPIGDSLFSATPSSLSGEQSSPEPDLSDRPSLGLLLRTALERSPRIGAARERALAAAEGPAIEGWLPDPMVNVGWYESAVETRVGPQRWSLGIQQRVPFPTRLVTRSRLADAEARRMMVGYERTVRDVLTEVIRTGWELVYLDQAYEITGEIEALLSRYVVAAAEGETGSPLPELFRAESQRAQLLSDRVLLAELRQAEASRLKSLLALSPGASIGVPSLPSLPAVETEFEELLALAEVANQELIEAGFALSAAGHRTSLAEQQWWPDFTFGASRIFTDELDPSLGMDPEDNGKDPVIFSAGITVPLWAQRNQATIRRARSLERAAALDRLDTAQRVRDRLARTWFRFRNADRVVELYREVLLPRAGQAARTAEDLMDSGKGSLAGALETIAVYHNFRLALERARADRGQALADVESILGRPFDRTPEGVR